jgi:cytochrome b involved in lipid metabolism
MKRKDFFQQIKFGAQYVILDDLVIDVKDFQFQHPGGKFVIQQNIGRDISKFFYGGYSMEDNLGPKPG